MAKSSVREPVELLLPVDWLGRILFRLLAFVSLAGLAAELYKYILLRERNWLSEKFSLSYESNVPTWYSASLLLTCALLLAVIALVQKRKGAGNVAYWWGLCAGFTYISLDETVSIHEHAGKLVDAGGGIFYFDWVIPFGVLVIILGLLYLKFLVGLPGWLRNRFMVAGLVYVGGAMGVELYLSWWTDNYGRHNLGYGLIDLVEETMEMLGITLFLMALLRFLTSEIRVTLRPGETGSEKSGA